MMEKYIDLHMHLDGAITSEIAQKLATLQKIELPVESVEALEEMISVPEDCTSLNDFLKCFAFPLSLMQTKEGIRWAVYWVLENIKEEILYGEIRFAPQLHCEKGLTQEEVILAALEGLKKGMEDFQIKANLILCLMRGTGNEEKNEETMELARKYLVEDGGVVALDLAGAEGLFPTRDYKKLFEKAREYGIPFTIHAGEADGAESIKDALDFGASRIGHCIRTEADQDLLDRLAQEEIYIEMCPTSNRQTKAVEDMGKYPLMDYMKRGLLVTINTDDMAIERTTIRREFAYLEKEFDFSEEDVKIVITNAIDGAFTSERQKDWLRTALGVLQMETSDFR